MSFWKTKSWKNVALASTKTIDIEVFAPRNSIDWIWLDAPYYLLPSDQSVRRPFAVIRDAMAAEKMVGISRLVISRRERAVMLEPRGKGIVLGPCGMAKRCGTKSLTSGESTAGRPIPR